MAIFGDFFGDLFGSESAVKRLARALGKAWGEGAMQAGTDSAPTDWGKFLLIRASFLSEIRSYIEAVGDQAFPPLARYSVETWEYIKRVPPAPAGMLLGDRLARLKAYCKTAMGARLADILEALLNITGIDEVDILERRAVDCEEGPADIYEFYTLVPEATFEDEDLRGDVNEIVDRWKPGHTRHGRGTYGGTRVGSPAANNVPAYFKTGSGPEKTGRNLIKLKP